MANLSYALDDKVFVVTGGSRGIGLTIAELLLAQRAKVVICGRKQEGLDAAQAVLRGGGGDRLLAQITGMDEKTIRRGREELDSSLEERPSNRVRLPGAGRPAVEEKTRQ